MEIIWHFKKNKEDFIIDNLRNFYTSLQSCFYLESYIDEGCVIVVFSVLYYAYFKMRKPGSKEIKGLAQGSHIR